MKNYPLERISALTLILTGAHGTRAWGAQSLIGSVMTVNGLSARYSFAVAFLS